jgi:hypothetical protein
MCFQHHVTILYAILYYVLFDLRLTPLSKEYYGIDFISIICLDVMSIFMPINYILSVCMLLSFVLYYYHVYERGRSSETMILSPDFSHKKFSSYFMLFYIQYLKPENHKNLVTYFVYFGFENL